MKSLLATALAVVFLSAGQALAAETVDMGELTCKQFSAYDDDNRGIVMMWFEGYYTEDDEPAVLDFGKLAGHTAEILIKCEANPDAKIVDLADEVMDD